MGAAIVGGHGSLLVPSRTPKGKGVQGEPRIPDIAPGRRHGIVMSDREDDMIVSGWNRLVGGLLLLVLVAACASGGGERQEEESLAVETASEADKRLLKPSALAEIMRSYADQYVAMVTEVGVALTEGNPDPQQRLMVKRLRLMSANAMYDIVTNKDPFTQLLDVVVLVSLQSAIWIDDNRAEEIFGDRGEILISRLRRARELVWDAAARALTPEQLQTLDFLIWEFRKSRPDATFVEMVRFGEFADSRSKSAIDQVRTGGGLMAPVKQVSKTAEKFEALADRAFFLAKRTPMLATWYADLAVANLVAEPELAAMLERTERITTVLERYQETIEILPDRITEERKAILEAVESTSGTLRDVIDKAEDVVQETNTLTANLQGMIDKSDALLEEAGRTSEAMKGTLEVAERIMVMLRIGEEKEETEPEVPARAFDILEYTEAVRELSKTIKETTDMLLQTESLIAAPAWTERLEEIQSTATGGVDAVGARGQAILNMMFWRSLLLLLIFFALLAGYRLYAVKMVQRVKVEK
jgi:hypothetical protein